jgi:hypothetical protein
MKNPVPRQPQVLTSHDCRQDAHNIEPKLRRDEVQESRGQARKARKLLESRKTKLPLPNGGYEYFISCSHVLRTIDSH